MYREPFVCPICNGRGIVPQEFYEPNRRHYDSTNMKLNYLVDMATCRTCGGTGIVWPPEERWEITC